VVFEPKANIRYFFSFSWRIERPIQIIALVVRKDLENKYVAKHSRLFALLEILSLKLTYVNGILLYRAVFGEGHSLVFQGRQENHMHIYIYTRTLYETICISHMYVCEGSIPKLPTTGQLETIEVFFATNEWSTLYYTSQSSLYCSIAFVTRYHGGRVDCKTGFLNEQFNCCRFQED
jgi:hypothetical protein